MTRALRWPDLLDEYHRTLHLQDAAGEVIADMIERCEEIARRHGVGEEYHRAASSLHHCLREVFARIGFAREASISKDGELSLFVNEGGTFVFGMIFHSDTREPRSLSGEWSLHS